jgi:hypothetical protein
MAGRGRNVEKVKEADDGCGSWPRLASVLLPPPTGLVLRFLATSNHPESSRYLANVHPYFMIIGGIVCGVCGN